MVEIISMQKNQNYLIINYIFAERLLIVMICMNVINYKS